MKKIISGIVILCILICVPVVYYNYLNVDENGFYKTGYKSSLNKYTETEFDKLGFDINRIDKQGYNINGFNDVGFNRKGFDKNKERRGQINQHIVQHNMAIYKRVLEDNCTTQYQCIAYLE